MFAKSMTTALIGSALMATAAIAQTPSASTSTAAPAATAAADTSHQGEWRASKVVGVKIYNDSNESLGSINDLLMDKDGKIAAVVVGVGGFLGVGEHYVAVPFEKVKWVNEPVPYTGAGGGSAMKSGGSSSSTTTGAAPAAAPAAKPNPWYPDHGVISATKDELKAMPQFKYSS